MVTSFSRYSYYPLLLTAPRVGLTGCEFRPAPYRWSLLTHAPLDRFKLSVEAPDLVSMRQQVLN